MLSMQFAPIDAQTSFRKDGIIPAAHRRKKGVSDEKYDDGARHVALHRNDVFFDFA